MKNVCRLVQLLLLYLFMLKNKQNITIKSEFKEILKSRYPLLQIVQFN